MILPQVLELPGLVQVCISNNKSTDETGDLVAGFQQQYPELIKYQEQERNFGAHTNFLKVMEMSDGQFVWLLGDDDTVVAGGIKKVIDALAACNPKETGLLALACQSYFVESSSGREITYSSTLQKNKPVRYAIDRNEVIGQSFPAAVFISILLLNNDFLKKIFQEEKDLVKKAVEAKEFIHTFLYRLMFLKYRQLQALWVNEIIVRDEAHRYKFYVEDIFQIHYITWVRLCDLLLSSGYAAGYESMIAKDKRRVVKMVMMEMAMMKCFGGFNYTSFSKCIQRFFQEAPVRLALAFSFSFVVCAVVPSFMLRNLYKAFVRLKHGGNWKNIWLYVTVKNANMAQGSRRLFDYGT